MSKVDTIISKLGECGKQAVADGHDPRTVAKMEGELKRILMNEDPKSALKSTADYIATSQSGIELDRFQLVREKENFGRAKTVSAVYRFFQKASDMNSLNPARGFLASMVGDITANVKGRMNSVWGRTVFTRNMLHGLMEEMLIKYDVKDEFVGKTFRRKADNDLGVMQELSKLKNGGAPNLSTVEGKLAHMHYHIVYENIIPALNRAGAYISHNPSELFPSGVMHDAGKLRQFKGDTLEIRNKNYEAWRDHVIPLIDWNKSLIDRNNPQDVNSYLRAIFDNETGQGKHIERDTAVLQGQQAAKEDRLRNKIAVERGNLGEDELIGDSVASGSLSRKLSERASFDFINPEAAYDYMKKFGRGDMTSTLLHYMGKSAHDLVLMQEFGPNPELTIRAIRKLINEKAYTMDNAQDIKGWLNGKHMNGAIDILLGKTDKPMPGPWHKWTQGLINWALITKGGSIPLSAVPDLVTWHSTATWMGASQGEAWAAVARSFSKKNPEWRQAALSSGAMTDGLSGALVSKFAEGQNVGGMLYRMNQKMFTVNFMNWWNDTLKGGFAVFQATTLGKNADMAFDQLNPMLRNSLEAYDIGAKEWDLLRKQKTMDRLSPDGDPTAVLTAKHARLIPVEDMQRYMGWTDKEIANFKKGQVEIESARKKLILEQDPEKKLAIQNYIQSRIRDTGSMTKLQNINDVLTARDRLATSFGTFFTDQADTAVLTPGLEEKILTTGFGLQAGSVGGSAARIFMMFKTFPIAMKNKILRREMRAPRPNLAGAQKLVNSKLFRTSQLIAMATAAGYISMMAKDTARNQTRKKLLSEDGGWLGEWTPDKDTLLEAITRGGGLGIYGDYLLREYDRGNKNLFSVLGGPIAGMAPEIAALGSDIIGQATGADNGRSIKRSTGKLITQNIPFANLFYIKATLDYFILWQLQEFFNPGSTDRREKYMDRNRQDYIISPAK